MIALTRWRIASWRGTPSAVAARSWSWRISSGIAAANSSPQPSPWERLVVEEQQRAGGVALEAAGVDLGLEVEHDSLVAEADAEVLKAPVPAAGLRQRVVELVAVHGGGVTGRGPKRRFAAAGTMIVVEHPPVSERVA